MEKKKFSKDSKKFILLFLLLITVLISILGLTYAYFGLRIRGNEEASSMRLTTADLRLIYTDNLVIEGHKMKPGWTQTKQVTVENAGDQTVYYNIIWRDLLNEITNGEIVISATCTSDIQGNTCPSISEQSIPTYTTTTHNLLIQGVIPIEVGETHTYNVTVLFKDTGSNQNYNQNKNIYGVLNIDDGTPTDENCFTTEDIDSSTVRISGYTCTDTEIVIPAIINNKKVTEIKDGTSYGYHTTGVFGNSGLTSVILPSTLTKIGSSAFRYDNYANSGTQTILTSIVIPSSVTTIGDSAFANNQLTSVTIPSSVTTIGDYAFNNNQLTSVAIPSSLTTIENSVFRDNQLTSIVIPDSVTSIQNYAFYGNQLTSVTIPDSVIELRGYVFAYNHLTSVIISSNLTEISSHVFYSNLLSTVTIPNNIVVIGEHAFDLNILASVTIKGKSSSSDFTCYGRYDYNGACNQAITIWGWASGVTCVTDNTSNVTNGCITWGA